MEMPLPGFISTDVSYSVYVIFTSDRRMVAAKWTFSSKPKILEMFIDSLLQI